MSLFLSTTISFHAPLPRGDRDGVRIAADVAMTTGLVVADGIAVQPGFFARARGSCIWLNQAPAPRNQFPMSTTRTVLWACVWSRFAHTASFDERLPLYAWLEDVDFSRRLACHGRIVKVPSARGVHLGVKSGRQSGVRLGYSQVANPIYLMRKGTCCYRKASYQMAQNLLMNFARSLWPEPYIDRQGRAFGNARAILDLIVGRLNPSRILSL